MKKIRTGTFDVYLNGKLIDTIFCSDSMTKEEAKDGLVNHDGYNPNISLRHRWRETTGTPERHIVKTGDKGEPMPKGWYE